MQPQQQRAPPLRAPTAHSINSFSRHFEHLSSGQTKNVGTTGLLPRTASCGSTTAPAPSLGSPLNTPLPAQFATENAIRPPGQASVNRPPSAPPGTTRLRIQSAQSIAAMPQTNRLAVQQIQPVLSPPKSVQTTPQSNFEFPAVAQVPVGATVTSPSLPQTSTSATKLPEKMAVLDDFSDLDVIDWSVDEAGHFGESSQSSPVPKIETTPVQPKIDTSLLEHKVQQLEKDLAKQSSIVANLRMKISTVTQTSNQSLTLG